MSLPARLADAAEAQAGVSNDASPMSRTALALESIGGVSRLLLSLPQRIALASQDINSVSPITGGSPFSNAAANLESAATVSSDASPIERMIVAIKTLP